MFKKSLAILLAAVAAAPALAADMPPAEPGRAGPVTVIVQRERPRSTDFLTHESAVFDSTLASSCAFFSGAFGPGRINENAPWGDASSAFTRPFGHYETPWNWHRVVPCSRADAAFAAGRHRIARKDTTLREGFAAHERGDYAAAMAQFRENYRKLGRDAAALMIGKMYLLGQGVPADTGAAIDWLRKVVDARFTPGSRPPVYRNAPYHMSDRAEAALTLANIHQAGFDVPKDERAARDWIAVAAEAGYVPATARLGLAYLSGFGGDRHPSKGVKYLKRAAEAGYPPAMYQLGRLYYTGEDGIARDLAMAGAYFAAAAKQGDARAQYAAARMYDLGETVAPDRRRALALYRDAAVQGVPDAQNALATYFYQGELVARNLDTARKLFNEAALRAQPDGMFNLAAMTMRGEGGPRDLVAAYAWFSLSKAGGHPAAAAALEEVAPLLSADELARAGALLAPRREVSR